ncbi:hypothetical protein, partial [Microbulbifer hainanensis]|uniref:hypothetical protein n=1 Tax=Microbulbifer hainanensis TaxID=2735675 RepID=UPI001D00EC85
SVERVGLDTCPVRKCFSFDNIAIAHTYERCGCAFQVSEYLEWYPEQLDIAKQSAKALESYIDNQLLQGKEVEAIPYWDGLDPAEITQVTRVKTDIFLSESFVFDSGDHLRFSTHNKRL